MKVAGLMGSLQMVNIICSILRSKLVAIWMGPAAMGLFGIFNSALEMLSMLSQMGLRPSAVRELGMASNERVPRVVGVVRRVALGLGLAGAALTLVCSPLLSRLTFGDTSWWWAFASLSLAVLLNALNNSEAAIFQGLRRFRKLTRCTMAGVVGGCLLSIPMFYFWRMQSIIPSILAYAICTWIALGLYRERIPRDESGSQRTLRDDLPMMRKMITFGAYLTAMGFITYAVNYLFMTILNHLADPDTVGNYNAASTLVNRYGALVITALSMEYLPRLSAHCASQRRTSVVISNQIFIVMLALIAVVPMFIALSQVLIRLLYSSAFLPSLPFLAIAAAALFFIGISWCMATEIIARGDGRTFFVTEITSGLASLILSTAGYLLGGFTGLGIAYALWYAFYCAIIAWVYFRRYRLRLTGTFTPILLTAALTTLPTLLLALAGHPLRGLLIAIPSSLWALNRLRLKFLGR